MITIIIFAIIAIAISIYTDFLYSFMKAIGFALIGAILGLFIAILLPMKTCEKVYSFNIENLQDNNSTNGSLFLGSGQINGEMKYIFYYKENEFYKMGQIDYDKAKIKYSNGQPRINVIQKYPVNCLLNNFSIDFDAFDKTYIIKIPKGTIKNDYSLDAK